MRRIVILSLILAAPASALAAGGFELDEQSARAVGTAGAQTAIANDPAAVFYNPAGLAFLPGFGALVGGNLVYARTEVVSSNRTHLSHVGVAPNVFLSQRFGRHVAIGFGMFTQFAENFGYPADFPGRFLGQYIDITTVTFDLSVAVRILPQVSIGAGLDVMVGAIDLYQQINFGGAEGGVHVGANSAGVGGNVGLLVELIPGLLRFGGMYRSRINLDFDGDGAISGPPELQGMTGGLLKAKTTLPLPHTIAAGLALDPTRRLTLSADVRISLWRDLQTLTLTLTDPAAPSGTAPQQQSVALNFHNAWAIRVGGELRFFGGHLHLRLGAGYDSTPVPAASLSPLAPDSQRVIVSGGIGWHEHWFAIDGGYLAAILLERTATNPAFPATYSTNGHVFSLNLTVRLSRAGHRINYETPPPELREEPRPRHETQ
ncbi:MAG: rane protein involved in aromatic hydrocarbon degradation [Myxococcales bacterium]|nr:rane protein involved in aromatic hydrocarbon degradation [Myxococcales bacterium]